MKSEEIIFMVFVGLLVIAIPSVFYMMNREEKRRKEEENRLWKERRNKRLDNMN